MVTAGGLVFIAATNDHRFRAFDSKTGKLLWETRLEYSAHANPITYQGKDGKQYVAIVAAGGDLLDNPSVNKNESLVAFALPKHVDCGYPGGTCQQAGEALTGWKSSHRVEARFLSSAVLRVAATSVESMGAILSPARGRWPLAHVAGA